MPPRLGLYSLADTPEDLLSQGYGMVNTEFADDPAFGGLAYNTAYNTAPYTGAMPFQNVFRISEGQYYGDLDNPSFGGSSNPRFNQFGKDIEFINAPQDIYPAAVPPDFINAPQNFYPPNLTSTKGLPTLNLQSLPANMGVANEKDVEQVNSLAGQKKSGGIMDLIMSIAVPGYGFLKNIGRGGLEGIRGLNQRIQQSDFGRSKTLADYFDAKSYGGRDARDRAASQNMREARAIQKQVDMRGDSTSRVADRNRSSVTRSSAAKSKGVGGGGYTKSDSTRESYRGRY
jgi:hypothetical protein